ncbi:hypothetical protein GGI19_000249 [Coemansia pectinata]|uniref:EF-hand domain-containing protein n=1 Tax=Coemansia pectinata TaxID=1052879 RepID=A0A9W8LDX4_9FUNG|nr:hypothetical protein GGI19_000249 [Coemansia pectinata]
MPNIKFRSEQNADYDEKAGASAVIDMPSAGVGLAATAAAAAEHNGRPHDVQGSSSGFSGSTLAMPACDIPSNLQDDFNWDTVSEENGEVDEKDEGAKKVKGFWRMHPLVRALCIMISGGLFLMIPVVAVMASHRDLPFRDTLQKSVPNYQFKYNLQCVARSFALLAAVWVFGTLIYHLVDMVPDAALNIVRTFKGKRGLEKLKDRMQFFIAVKAFIKMILISATSLIAFVIMFPNASYRFIGKVDAGSSSWDQALFQINVLLLFACTIIGVEKLVLKIIATRFHKSAYKERIEQQAYASWVLDHLNRSREAGGKPAVGSAGNTPYAMSQAGTFPHDADATGSRSELLAGTTVPNNAGFAEALAGNDGVPQKLESPPALGKSHSGSSSLWRNTFSGTRSPKLQQPPRHQKKPSKSFATRLWNIKDRALDGGIDMNSNQYASRLARKLFGALHSDRDYLVVDDFLPFFEKEEDAIKAFEFFDKDGNGDISKREMRDRVVLIYKERRSLISALNDMSQVVGKLDLFMTIFALVIVLIVALMVFGVDALKTFATIGPLLIGWSFIFGGACKTAFECLIFLFSVHSYDVGDTVVVVGESLTVSKIWLLSTVFFKTDGTYTVYANSQLATMKIQNLRRSKPQSESIVIGLDFNTPSDKIYAIRERMNEYAEENPRDLVSPVGFNVDLLENTNRVQISVGINYKSNWQDGAKHFAVKTKFAFALRHVIHELGLRYALPLQPVTMVSPPPGYDEDPIAPKPSSLRRRPTNSAAEDSDDEDIFGIRQPSAAEDNNDQQRANAQNPGAGRQGTQNDPSIMGVAAIAGMAMANNNGA